MVALECLNEVLIDSANEVFETMVFMDLIQTEDISPVSSSESLIGSITFRNGIEGCLTIGCDKSCAAAIARNMLGLDPDEEVTDDDIRDAIGEIANMVMGSVKSRIAEDSASIQVSIPTVISGAHIQAGLAENANHAEIDVTLDDEYRLKISLHYKETAD
jgi:chemotaxis protein CheX